MPPAINLRIMDGTESMLCPNAFFEFCYELSEFVNIFMDNDPRNKDPIVKSIVKELENGTYNPERNQVDVDELAHILDGITQEDTFRNNLVFLDSDIYGGTTAFFFGTYLNNGFGGNIVISAARLQDCPEFAYYILAHEFGHMLGAAPLTRATIWQHPVYGRHCINHGCSLVHMETVHDAWKYALARKTFPAYCDECKKDITDNIETLVRLTKESQDS